MTSFRGEIWFRWGELPGSSTNQPAYAQSFGGFGANNYVGFVAGQPFVDLDHSNGEHTLIFTIKSDDAKLSQAHFPALSSGAAFGATGAIEVVTNTGSFLYQILDGNAYYIAADSYLVFTLRTGTPRSA